MTNRRLPLVLALLLAVLVAPARLAWADVWSSVSDHWYLVELDGAVAGWTNTKVDRSGDRLRTSTQTSLRFDRGDTEVAITMKSGFIETETGEALKIIFLQEMGRMSLDTEWTFGPDAVTIVSRQGGRDSTSTAPLPAEGWLPPQAAARFWLEQRDRGVDRISFVTISPENGLAPITVESTRTGEGELEIDRRQIPTTHWDVSYSNLSGLTARQVVSSDGILLREEIPAPFGTMVKRMVTQREALAAANADAPELLVETFVRPDRPIPRAREVRRAVLELSSRQDRLPALPSAGAQTAVMSEDGKSATITIDLDQVLESSAEDAADEAYLKPNAVVDSSDELVIKLAERSVRTARDDAPAARAEAMRGFVHRFVSGKGLDTAFATASETARTRSGDCSEHAVLLCAMLRSQGIPARVATGLIYVDTFIREKNIFGWHMWTQALVDGRWVDLDATLPVAFDGAHVLTSTSSLADGTGDLGGMLMLMGNLDIEVLDLQYGGRPNE